MNKYCKHIVGIAGIYFLLTACNVSKKYSRQDLDIPSDFRGDTIALTSDTLQLSWKQFVKDPILTKLISMALQKNNDMTVAFLNMQQLELAYKQAKKGLLPSVGLELGANRTWLSTNSLNGSLSDQFLGTPYMDDYNATLSVAWEADIWGKAKMQKQEALANFFAQQANVQVLRTKIIVQVIQSYYNLIILDEQLKIAQKNVVLSDSTLQMIRMQYDVSQVSSLAVLQAEAQKKTAELLIPMANQSIAMEENALSVLCGSFPSAIERTDNFNAEIIVDSFPTGVPAALLSKRPDVKAAEYAVIAANSRTGLAKVAMYPSISLSPSIGTNSFKFNSWFDLPGSIVKTITANVTQPLLQKGALKTNYELAQLEQEKAAVQFKQSVMLAVSEVSNALAKIKYSNERLLLIDQKSQSLSQATNDALLLYKNGMANYLEVITAQNNALQNDLELLNTQREKWHAVADLYLALGGPNEE